MTHKAVSVTIWAGTEWVPLAQAFIEKSCPVFGLDREQVLRLTMAVEEVVVRLAETSPGSAVSLNLVPGGWHVRAELSFAADPSDLWAMNLCAGSGVARDQDMAHLGLVLASRMVSRFSIRFSGRTVRLSLRQDLSYPVVDPEPIEPLPQKGGLSIDPDPDPDLVKTACLKALGRYPADSLHQSFFTPGKLADMVAQKDMNMALALTEANEPAGAVCWLNPSADGLFFFGPYTFEEGDRCAQLLSRHLIEQAARTSAKGMFSARATKDLPRTDFECLGHLGGGQAGQKIWYRHLGEDAGTTVWSHPDLIPFLKKNYQDLVLMREIREIRDLGETIPDRSVLSSRLRHRLSEAVLVPLVGGRDMKDCLADHVRVLRAEGYERIFFHMDLGWGWQAALAEAVAGTGFVPRLVLPYGGRSDMVVFEHEQI